MLSGTSAIATVGGDVLFEQNFEDNADGLTLHHPSTTSIVDQFNNAEQANNQYLQFDNSVDLGFSIATIDLVEPLPERFDLGAEFHSKQAPRSWNDAFLIFDYQSPTDFKYAGTFVGHNKWVIGQYDGNQLGRRFASIDWDDEGRTVQVNRDYLMHLEIDGSAVQLFVDGEAIVGYDFGDDVTGGDLGVASYNAKTWFDNVTVRTPASPDFPHFEGFDSGELTSFSTQSPEKVSVLTDDSEGYLQINSTIGGGLGTATLTTDSMLPANLDIATEITSIYEAGKWHDGFVVFDYVSDSDFKYAGMFTGQNQWVIGHFEGNWGNRLFQVDWDDTGRTIDLFTPYVIHLDINDSSVSMKVDSELIGTVDFGESLNDGKTGLASYNAKTRFNWFEVDDVITIGGYEHIPYTEDFESGTTGLLEYQGTTTGSVITSGGSKVLKFDKNSGPDREIAILPDSYPLPHHFNVGVDVVFETGSGLSADGYIVFDYVDDQNFKYAGVTEAQLWTIGKVVDGVNSTVANKSFASIGRFLATNQNYRFHLAVEGNTAEISLNGESILSANFGAKAYGGSVGLMVRTGSTLFDNFELDETVDNPVDFSPDYIEDFRSVAGGQFEYFNEAQWDKRRTQGDYSDTFDGTETGDLGVLTLPTPYQLPENFYVRTTLELLSPSGLESTDRDYNGFIIFDYVNENDFKYAGILQNENKWVIGHYQGDFASPLAETTDFVDLDEQIQFDIRVYGSTVHLYVDFAPVLTAEFGSLVNTGDVGLGAKFAETSFYEFYLDEIDAPAPAPLADSVFSDSVDDIVS